VPGGQSAKVAFVVWFSAAEKLPAGTCTGAAPFPGQNVPAGHHCVFVVLPSGQNMPGWLQLRHDATVVPPTRPVGLGR